MLIRWTREENVMHIISHQYLRKFNQHWLNILVTIVPVLEICPVLISFHKGTIDQSIMSFFPTLREKKKNKITKLWGSQASSWWNSRALLTIPCNWCVASDAILCCAKPNPDPGKGNGAGELWVPVCLFERTSHKHIWPAKMCHAENVFSCSFIYFFNNWQGFFLPLSGTLLTLVPMFTKLQSSSSEYFVFCLTNISITLQNVLLQRNEKNPC